jgi:hypothetical protein
LRRRSEMACEKEHPDEVIRQEFGPSHCHHQYLDT